jgi:cytidylate kinase
MKDDPIVAEIRKYRQEHAAKFNYDLDAIVKDIRSREGKDGRRVVTLPPKLRPAAK